MTMTIMTATTQSMDTVPDAGPDVWDSAGVGGETVEDHSANTADEDVRMEMRKKTENENKLCS